MVILIIKPSCLKTTPAIPLTNIRGINTTIVVKAEAVMAGATSFVAKTAASSGFSPESIWRVIFSKTTMALSTTMPMAIAKLIKDIMFIVNPFTKRKMNAQISEKGMDKEIIILAKVFLKKSKATKITKIPATIKVLVKLPMAFKINSELSIGTVIFTSGGKSFLILPKNFFISLQTSTVFAPDCF